jgi:hypothetical protein
MSATAGTPLTGKHVNVAMMTSGGKQKKNDGLLAGFSKPTNDTRDSSFLQSMIPISLTLTLSGMKSYHHRPRALFEQFRGRTDESLVGGERKG